MPIPALTLDGILPEGVHDCTLEEIGERFGAFRGSDVRVRLSETLKAYLKELGKTGFAVAAIIDGSFVTSKPEPEDIDLIVIVASGHNFETELRPFEYNLLSRRRVHRLFGFDLMLASADSGRLGELIDFFSQVKNSLGRRKGLLRVQL